MQKTFYSKIVSEKPTEENLEIRRRRWEVKSEMDQNHFAQDRGNWPVFDVICHVHIIKFYGADTRLSAGHLPCSMSCDANPVAGICENNNESLGKTKDRKLYCR